MRLTRIELENVRAFGHAEFDLTRDDGKPSEMVLLVGKNGSGKSTVLHAIGAFFQV